MNVKSLAGLAIITGAALLAFLVSPLVVGYVGPKVAKGGLK